MATGRTKHRRRQATRGQLHLRHDGAAFLIPISNLSKWNQNKQQSQI